MKLDLLVVRNEDTENYSIPEMYDMEHCLHLKGVSCYSRGLCPTRGKRMDYVV